MSLNLMRQAFLIEFPHNSHKLVALKLAEISNGEGDNLFPSIETLARECTLHKATVIRALQAFEEAGLLTVDERDRSPVRRGRTTVLRSFDLDVFECLVAKEVRIDGRRRFMPSTHVMVHDEASGRWVIRERQPYDKSAFRDDDDIEPQLPIPEPTRNARRFDERPTVVEPDLLSGIQDARNPQFHQSHDATEGNYDTQFHQSHGATCLSHGATGACRMVQPDLSHGATRLSHGATLTKKEPIEEATHSPGLSAARENETGSEGEVASRSDEVRPSQAPNDHSTAGENKKGNGWLIDMLRADDAHMGVVEHLLIPMLSQLPVRSSEHPDRSVSMMAIRDALANRPDLVLDRAAKSLMAQRSVFPSLAQIIAEVDAMASKAAAEAQIAITPVDDAEWQAWKSHYLREGRKSTPSLMDRYQRWVVPSRFPPVDGAPVGRLHPSQPAGD